MNSTGTFSQRFRAAAQSIFDSWEGGDLAGAVRGLQEIAQEYDEEMTSGLVPKLMNNDFNCPRCGSRNIHRGDWDAQGEMVSAICTCRDCHQVWGQFYELTKAYPTVTEEDI